MKSMGCRVQGSRYEHSGGEYTKHYRGDYLDSGVYVGIAARNDSSRIRV